MPTRLHHGVLMLTSLLAAAGCGESRVDDAPPVATPSFAVDRERAPLGSPIEVTYRFVVSDNAERIEKDHRVFVHVLDSDRELMWTDDHDPSVPTSEWRAGQTVEYKRTIFVPIYPYIGQASVEMGLYSTDDDSRLSLAGEDSGQRAYRVGTLQLLPQSENVFLIFKDGWQRAEVSPADATVEWQWTTKLATISFRNPRRDALLYLEVDGRSDLLPEPQQVTVAIGDQVLETFSVVEVEPALHKIPISGAQLGTSDMVDLTLEVDRTFVPAQLPGEASSDTRELGVRVFHVFIQPQ